MPIITSPLAACCLPALPFRPEDFAARDAFQKQVKGYGVWVAITGDHQDIPDAMEISWPHDRFDTRWLVWRNAAGCWIDEFDTQDRSGPLATMAEALTVAGKAIGTERVKAAAPSGRGLLKA